MSTKFFEFRQAFATGEIAGVIAAFNQLPGVLARKHVTAAMRRAVKPFQPALRQATPVGTGGLRRSVKTLVRYYQKANWAGNIVGVVGYARGGSKPNKMGNHSAIVEKGTGDRYRRNGAYVGRMPARRMLRDTIAANRQAIAANLTREMAVGLERAARELAGAQAKGKYRGY